ncbi:MAG: phosphate ABC transporter permease PstA [Candidatus Nitrosopumilus limneticus]|nr:Phosphate transport system permease protein PstA [Candidatus Nitrosopumilus limneticus]MDC4212849.1 phosphate ABC transporter permease PstA [Candidatus Nitrosopumilus limneticus]MDC4215540.1 phosphate ABC transporter permease PstA [Candidatus Nitrosopumilus limneticus]MDC4216947.1 phosphate ABC transporter permease PstA [Candidatus Nitrosopumilus limneticus]MDC4218029.1 phosphate ABC transporter permease PstA [Candidatus Nitrosopumilus limneticus]
MTTNERRQEYRTLFKQNVKNRLLVDKVVRIVVFSCVIIALIPLCSILVEVFKNGISAMSYEFLTTVPGAVGSGEGGIGPAIQGTLIIIGLSSLIGIPIGVMSGIYLSEYGDNKLARSVRFFNDVFMEFPSIVLGIFAFLVIVLVLGHFSVWAGAFALSLIMFPIVARTTEESLKMVPITYREAGTALGLKKWVITFRIVITAAKSGMITGILLSVSRIGGETAPLIMTILGSSQFFRSMDVPMDALPLNIYKLSQLPYESAQLQGWGSALVLIIIILGINLSVRYYFANKTINGVLGKLIKQGVLNKK